MWELFSFPSSQLGVEKRQEDLATKMVPWNEEYMQGLRNPRGCNTRKPFLTKYPAGDWKLTSVQTQLTDGWVVKDLASSVGRVGEDWMGRCFPEHVSKSQLSVS